jgi:hypothetical protein
MKLLIYTVLLFISVTAQSFSQETENAKKSPPAGNAVVGDFYGTDVTKASENKAISV